MVKGVVFVIQLYIKWQGEGEVFMIHFKNQNPSQSLDTFFLNNIIYILY